MGNSHSCPDATGKTVELGHETTGSPPYASGLCPSSSNRAICYGKVVRGLGLAQQHRGDASGGAENNKSWLLADATAESEPSSVHSSFRFSSGSEAEAEEVVRDAMALLLVSLEDGVGEHIQEEQQWERLQSLERSISPIAPLIRFSYIEIRGATRGFCAGRELGRGQLSRVYKGRIGVLMRAVAIKRVDSQDRESAKAFCRELTIAGSLCHPNIVPLIGFCIDPEGLFLVYKRVSGGNLDRHLHQHENRKGNVLSCEARYKVAVGVARALKYLHYGTDKCVVHRDIKPSNILLSSDRTPKLCDFGLATWTNGPSLPFFCKSVKGTFGYLAPEYFQHGKLSDRTDVYAFGVVLLELITGRKVIDRSGPLGNENLVLWAKPLIQHGEGAMEELIDPRLKADSCQSNSMSRMVRAASACLRDDESERPSIDQVIGMLQWEEQTCTDFCVFTGNRSFAGYHSELHELSEKSDMKGHLALAMLEISDTEEGGQSDSCLDLAGVAAHIGRRMIFDQVEDEKGWGITGDVTEGNSSVHCRLSTFPLSTDIHWVKSPTRLSSSSDLRNFGSTVDLFAQPIYFTLSHSSADQQYG